MRLVSLTLTDAKAFVAKYHRHNDAPVSWKFGVGLEHDGELIGVAMAGRPEGRGLDKPGNICVTRACVRDGHKNAGTMLYGAILRACAALGYKTAYTYTLAEESGASLKASNWKVDAELPARATWDCPARRRTQIDMFGNDRRPPGAKVRWRYDLVKCAQLRQDGTRTN